MCTTFDLVILNGLCNGDLEGRYTYTGENGSSVDDYFIMSSDMFSYVCDSVNLYVADRSESDHFPVELRIIFSHDSVSNCDDKCTYVTKLYV